MKTKVIIVELKVNGKSTSKCERRDTRDTSKKVMEEKSNGSGKGRDKGNGKWKSNGNGKAYCSWISDKRFHKTAQEPSCAILRRFESDRIGG